MPAAAPQTLLTQRHDSATSLTVALVPGATQMQVSAGVIFDDLPTPCLLEWQGTVEIVTVDASLGGTLYSITRSVDGTSAGAVTFPVGTPVQIVFAAEAWRRLLRAYREKLAGYVTPQEYGAVADGKCSYGTMPSGTNTVTLNGAYVWRFTAADIGKRIVVKGAGGFANTPLVSTIAAVDSPLVARTVAVATSTASGRTVLWGTDDTAALQAAIDSLPTNGGRLWLPKGTYVITGTLTLRPQMELVGSPGVVTPGVDETAEGSSTLDITRRHQGSTLAWAGAAAQPMLKIFNAMGVTVQGVVLNSETGSSITGILVDGDNSARTGNLITLDSCCFWDCTTGLQHGTTQGPPALGLPNLGYQNDTLHVQRCWFDAPDLKDVARGIVVNSSNTQASHYERCIFQELNVGLDFRVMGGFSSVDRCIFGSIAFGANATAILVEPNCGEILVMNTQAESCTKFIWVEQFTDHNPALPGGNSAPIVLLNCHVDNDVVVDRGSWVVSIGSSSSLGAGPRPFISNNAVTAVVSIMDLVGTPSATQPAWQMNAGQLYELGAYGLRLGKDGTVLTGHRAVVFPAVAFGAIADGQTVNADLILNGVNIGDCVQAFPLGSHFSGLVWNVTSPAANTIRIRMTNVGVGGPMTPTVMDWKVYWWRN